MIGTLCEEIEMNGPASEAWGLFSTLQFSKVLAARLSDTITKIDVVQGDGGAGTIIQLFFAPGVPGLTSYKEKFVVVDHARRVKETEMTEGGYLDHGFTSYRIRFEVIEKEGTKDKCITKVTIDYELKDEASANASLASMEPIYMILKVANDYLVENYSKNVNK